MTRSKSAIQIKLVFAALLVSLFRFAFPNSGWCQDGFLEAPLENKIYHAEMLSAAISPDGQLVVTYGSTKLTTNPRELVVWDVATGRRLRSIPELRRTEALAISPDGRTLAAGGGQHQQLSGLRLFDLGSGRLIKSIYLKSNPTDHDILCLAWSPDSKFIATGSRAKRDSDGKYRLVRIWDAAQGKMVQAITSHKQNVRAITYSKDGQLLVAGGDDGITVWDVRRAQETCFISKPSVCSLAISPDAKRIAVCTTQGEVGIWDANNGALVRSYDTGFNRSNSVVFNSTGDQIIVGLYRMIAAFNGLDDPSDTSSEPMWFIDTGDYTRTKKIFLRPDNKSLVTIDEGNLARLWDMESKKEQATLRLPRPIDSTKREQVSPPEVKDFEIDSTGARIAIADDAGRVTLWDLKKGSLISNYDFELSFDELSWSPSGDKIGLAMGSQCNVLNITAATSTFTKSDSNRRRLGFVSWLTDSDLIVGADTLTKEYKPMSLEVLGLSGKSKFYLADSSERIALMCVSRDKKWVATAPSNKAEVVVWEIASGKLHRRFNVGTGGSAPLAIALSPNAEYLAASNLNEVHIYNMSNGRGDSMVPDRKAERISISPDGKKIALALSGSNPEGRVEVRELNALTSPPTILDGHNSKVRALDWSPDSQVIATGGEDSTIRFFRIKDGFAK